MITKKMIIEFCISHWYFILCYVITIFGTHFLKNQFILFSGKFKSILVLVLSLILALISNLSIFLMIGFSWMWILLSLNCWAVSGFFTIFLDKLIEAGAIDIIIKWLKGRIAKFFS